VKPTIECTPRAAATSGGVGHRLGLLDGVGQRLLAQHVLAGLQRRDGDLGVRVARGANVDEVDVVAGDKRSSPSRRRPAELAGGPRRRRRPVRTAR
jgi:hypothetical protein